jgi:hypothetical protein
MVLFLIALAVVLVVWFNGPMALRNSDFLGYILAPFPVAVFLGWLLSGRSEDGAKRAWSSSMARTLAILGGLIAASGLVFLVVLFVVDRATFTQFTWALSYVLRRPNRIAAILLIPAATLGFGALIGWAARRASSKAWRRGTIILAAASVAALLFLATGDALFPKRAAEQTMDLYVWRHVPDIERQWLEALTPQQRRDSDQWDVRIIFCHIRQYGPVETHGTRATMRPLLHFRFPRSMEVRFEAQLQRKWLRWEVTSFKVAEVEP